MLRSPRNSCDNDIHAFPAAEREWCLRVTRYSRGGDLRSLGAGAVPMRRFAPVAQHPVESRPFSSPSVEAPLTHPLVFREGERDRPLFEKGFSHILSPRLSLARCNLAGLVRVYSLRRACFARPGARGPYSSLGRAVARSGRGADAVKAFLEVDGTRSGRAATDRVGRTLLDDRP